MVRTTNQICVPGLPDRFARSFTRSSCSWLLVWKYLEFYGG